MKREQCTHEEVNRILCEVPDCTAEWRTTVLVGWRLRFVCYDHAIQWETPMSHFYAPGHKYSVNAMRSEARKRAKRDGRTSTIHRHHADEDCDGHDHEEIGPDDVE